MMKCKDCSNFKSNIEAAGEVCPEIEQNKGQCNIGSKECKAMDDCNCGEFNKK